MSIRSDFQELLDSQLIPMFPGSTLTSGTDLTSRRGQLVSIKQGGLSLLIRDREEKGGELVSLNRVQKFSEEERNVAQSFMEVYPRLKESKAEPYFDDIAESAMGQVVAKVLGSDDLTTRLIWMLSSWSRQTYEGGRISFSLGINPSKSGDADSLLEMRDEDFIKVLSNGYDSMIEVGREGKVVGHRKLPIKSSSRSGFCPLRLEPLCDWTAKSSDRIALSLNRQGEVVAAKNGSLIFANRRGSWKYFSHESAIAQFTSGGLARRTSTELKEAVYETALDVGFSRTGGCIGVVSKANRKELGKDKIIRDRDLISSTSTVQSTKAKTLGAIIESGGEIKFQDLDRNLRQELVSIDGATVLGHDGEIISVGAILGVKGGAKTGGGRQAAAETLAKYGLGIKVSNDGYIRVLVVKDSKVTNAAEVG